MIQKQPTHRRLGKAERAQQGRLKLHHLFLNRSLLRLGNNEPRLRSEEPLMETFIDRYIAQSEQRGEAKMLLRQIERKFGAPSQPVRDRITQADSEMLLE